MYRWVLVMETVRMGSNKKKWQDIGIEYLTTYLQGEVAGGHAGGGTDTIEFLLIIDKGGCLMQVILGNVSKFGGESA